MGSKFGRNWLGESGGQEEQRLGRQASPAETARVAESSGGGSSFAWIPSLDSRLAQAPPVPSGNANVGRAQRAENRTQS